MDTDGHAGKAAEHSPSVQGVKQGKAHEEVPEEDAGQMHSAAQEQIAQALPEQATGQPPLSAEQEQAEEGLPEQATGQPPLSAEQEQIAQALPEQATGQPPLSAEQEQAEEGPPEQVAGLTPSVKAEALPGQRAWHTPAAAVAEQPEKALPEQPIEHTPAAAVAEQPEKALPEQPIEHTPAAAVAEAQPVEDTASMHRPACVTGVTLQSEVAVLSEQGVWAASPVAGEALPVQALGQTPSTASEAPSIEDTPSMHRQERGTARIAPSEQAAGHVPPPAAEAQETPSRHSAERGAASISGSVQGTGKAPAMTMEEVNALGQELCAKVRALSYEKVLTHAWASYSGLSVP